MLVQANHTRIYGACQTIYEMSKACTVHLRLNNLAMNARDLCKQFSLAQHLWQTTFTLAGTCRGRHFGIDARSNHSLPCNDTRLGVRQAINITQL